MAEILEIRRDVPDEADYFVSTTWGERAEDPQRTPGAFAWGLGQWRGREQQKKLMRRAGMRPGKKGCVRF